MAAEQFGFNNFNDFDFNLDYYYSDYSTPLKFKLVDINTRKRRVSNVAGFIRINIWYVQPHFMETETVI